MPLILPSNSISAGGYEVANSLRFDAGSSDSLSQTQSSGETKTFTYSCWFKKNRDLGSTEQDAIFTVGENNTNDFLIYFEQEQDRIDIIVRDSSTIRGRLTTNRKFRDYSAWMHIVFIYDSTNATAGNRMRLYINGVEETSFSTDTNPSLNQTTIVNNSSYTMRIGRLRTDARYLSGYLSECVLIDGTALDPTSFGEFDEDTGIWKPIDVSGLTFGTNGFYLDFENSGSLGADVSGNGNNFTVNNLTSIDQTTDTPTNNYATGNPLNIPTSNQPTFSNGNNTIAIGNSRVGLSSTIGMTQGKWYAEFKFTSAVNVNTPTVGISGEPAKLCIDNAFAGNSASNGVSITADGYLYDDGTSTYPSTWSSTFGLNDIVGVAIDLDNNYVYFSINGTWQNSGDPTSGASGTGGVSLTNVSSVLEGAYFFTTGNSSSANPCTWNANFGNPPFTISSGNSDGNGYGLFEYQPPSGYLALCTKNLATDG